MERINRLEDLGKNLERSIDVIKTSNIDQENRLIMLETNLSMLNDIRAQIEEIRSSLNKSVVDVVEIKTRLNIYIGIVCVIGSAVGSMLPVLIKYIPILIALL